MAGESAEEMARRSRERAARLQRRAEQWERGAAGERATADVLASLPVGWVTLHDVRWPGRPRANIDHVVVGPGGVFVVDSKNWSGQVRLERGVLRQNGRSRAQSTSGAAEAGRAVRSVVDARPEHLHAVLCVVGDHRLAGRSGEVLVCSTDRLRELLTLRKAVLSAEDVRVLSDRLGRGLVAAGEPRPGAASRARGATPSTRRKRAPRRRPAAWPRLVVGLAVAIALWLGGPGLVTHASQAFGRWYVGLSTPGAGPSCPTPSTPRAKATATGGTTSAQPTTSGDC